MLMLENAAALAVFVMLLAAFALGGALRSWTEAARNDWAEAFAYRQAGARARADRERGRYGRR